MDFVEGLRIDNNKELITFIGSGGKTTAMYRTARELQNRGERVFITTTTRVNIPLNNQVDKIIMGDSFCHLFTQLSEFPGKYRIMVGGGVEDNKVKSLPPDLIDRLYSSQEKAFFLVEGDGSKGRPIKGTADYEPVIPAKTTKIILVIGSWALGEKLTGDKFHRVEIISKLINKDINEIILPSDVAKLITAEKGVVAKLKGFDNIGVYINKNNDIKKDKESMELLDYLWTFGRFKLLATGDLLSENPYDFLWRDKKW